MREIKFRAQKENSKELVYGYFSQDYSGTAYITTLDGVDTSNVIPETIGQFTGLKDKSGDEIYEGKESVKLIIIGVGEGLADIVMHEGKWCVYENSQGYAPLYDLLNSNSTEIVSTLTQN